MGSEYLTFIQSSLSEASKIASSQFGQVTGQEKGNDNNQVLTETDLAIGRLLIQRIQTQFPLHNIIDEEAGVIDNKSEFTWVVDPIDGTSNFANGVPTYGIMIGLLHDATPIAGGISLPSFQQLASAEKDLGCFLNGQSVKVTEEPNLLKTLLAYGIDGHQENPEMTTLETQILADLILNVRNLRTSNSAFDLVMLACGHYGANLNRTGKIWDNVGPQIVVQEAGGMYTDFFGQPMDYADPLTKAEQNFTYCAAAPQLHTQIQSIIAKYKPHYV